MTRPIVFLDTETTSLRPDRRAWEIGLIRRDETGEHEQSWFVEASELRLATADPTSLDIGRFYQRHPHFTHNGEDTFPERTVLVQVERETRNAIIVGAVPNFDTEVLGARMRAHGILPSWHYHLVDVETLAAGDLGLRPPWNFDRVLNEYDLTYDEAQRHTALGDARMARDLYDAVLHNRGYVGLLPSRGGP